MWDGAERDAEHDSVELDPVTQHDRVAHRPATMMLEVERGIDSGVEPIAREHARETRKAVNPHQRLETTRRCGRASLSGEVDPLDALAGGIELEAVDPMKELDLDATAAQQLQHRSKDDVPHSG